jgi:hypothetical protein
LAASAYAAYGHAAQQQAVAASAAGYGTSSTAGLFVVSVIITHHIIITAKIWRPFIGISDQSLSRVFIFPSKMAKSIKPTIIL